MLLPLRPWACPLWVWLSCTSWGYSLMKQGWSEPCSPSTLSHTQSQYLWHRVLLMHFTCLKCWTNINKCFWLSLVLTATHMISTAALVNRSDFGISREMLHFYHFLYWASNLSPVLTKSAFTKTAVIPKRLDHFPLALLLSYVDDASFIYLGSKVQAHATRILSQWELTFSITLGK